CNRVGHEPDPTGSTPGIDFWGTSFMAGPQGEILAQASIDKEEVLVADVELARTETVRRIWPYLRARRVDAYPDLLRLYRDRWPRRPRTPAPAAAVRFAEQSLTPCNGSILTLQQPSDIAHDSGSCRRY